MSSPKSAALHPADAGPAGAGPADATRKAGPAQGLPDGRAQACSASTNCDGSLFRAAFLATRSIMFLIDPATGDIIDGNPAACEFYGYSLEEARHVSITDVSLMPRDAVLELMQGVLKGGAVQFASRHKLKSGELRDMELDATPIVLHDGRPAVFFVGHDITARMRAERALRERESLLKAILDSAGEGIGFKDVEHVYREANPAFCTMLGAPCEQVLGRKSEEFFDPETDARNLETDLQVLKERASLVYEIAYPARETDDGGLRQVSVNKSPVFDADGNPMGVVFISRDITRERKAGEALRKSESLLRAMMDSARDSIFVVDDADILREGNPAFCELMNKPREEILGRSLDEVFEPEELHLQRSTSSLTATTRQPVHFVQRIQRPAQGDDKPASDVWISVVKTAIEDDSGRFLGVLGMGRDITEQKAADLALRESERRFSTLVRQSPVGVFETDARGRLSFANERMQRQTARTQEQLLGNGWLMCVHAGDRADFVREWHAALAEAAELAREVRLAGPRGVVTWVTCRIRPMRDGAGRVIGYLGTLGDVTERKQAEALREDVEAVVRHDLKSPLGGMQSALELIAFLGPLTAEQEQVMGEARSLVRRMLGLITLSLDLAAIEAGRYTPRPEPVDLPEVLAGLKKELRPLVAGKILTLDILSDPPGGFTVLGERRLLDSALANLLKNAAEAAPEGGAILVRLRREPGPVPAVAPGQSGASPQASMSGHAVVSIRNPGEVPSDMRRRFFEKYATSGKTGGTGLGTYSAKLMVRTLGGSLSLDTDEAGHTTMTMRLPLPAEGAGAQTP